MKLRSKRKYSFEDFSQKKKIRLSKRKEEINLDNVINLRMPYIGEQIFESINTDDLFCVIKVSETWKILAENVLLKRWKGEMLQACKIGKTKVVKLLLEHYKSEKSGLNTKNENGLTPFIVACNYGHSEIVKLLLSFNIDLNARSDTGVTAFMFACINGRKEVVQLLLDTSVGNIDFNARNDYGMTAFFMACAEGQKDVVKLLFNQPGSVIDCNARSNYGFSGYFMACVNGHTDIIKILREEEHRTDADIIAEYVRPLSDLNPNNTT